MTATDIAPDLSDAEAAEQLWLPATRSVVLKLTHISLVSRCRITSEQVMTALDEFAEAAVDALAAAYEDHLRNVMPCRCSVCGLQFTSVNAFDAHRDGPKCLTPIDLAEIGYQPNERGLWGKPEVAAGEVAS